MTTWFAGRFCLLLACLGFGAETGVAATAPADRPLIYKLHCEGCHKPDGSGHIGFVPTFVDSIGAFVHVKEGRDFIIKVPGVSQSELSNRDIAELMNWLLVAYDPDGLPDDFVPYSEAEVEHRRRERQSRVGANRNEPELRRRFRVRPKLADGQVDPAQ